jgi:hypothetical protein
VSAAGFPDMLKPMLKPRIAQRDGNPILILPTWVHEQMMTLVHLLWKVRNLKSYARYCDKESNPVATFDPGNWGVCMGYDVHVRDKMMKLIEINTNAMGQLMIPQPPSVMEVLLKTFLEEWQAFGAKTPRPAFLALVEHAPESQKGYPEMKAFVDLFKNHGIPSAILQPHQIQKDAEGNLFAQGRAVEMVYLRWVDFYLESAQATFLQKAYLQKKICVTPSPREHFLLANKKRLAIFSHASLLQELGLSSSEADQLAAFVPDSLLMNLHPAEYWAEHKNNYVFKPYALHASKGVIPGRTLTLTRLSQMVGSPILAQQWVQPGELDIPGQTAKVNFDLRAFVYQSRIITYMARTYLGMVTRFTEGVSQLLPVQFE